jgi:glycerol-3-phosphate acyltransferase PlsY
MNSDFGFSFPNQDVVPSLAYLAIAFLVGSIPFGVIVGRLFYKTDLRQSGSGNIGAANALRSYGVVGGILVLVLDAVKGLAAADLIWPYFTYMGTAGTFFGVYVAVVMDGKGSWPQALLGFLAVLGHCYSPWLKFKGGKGVATFLGMLFAQSWAAGLGFVIVWLAVVAPSRYASLGSMIASALAPLMLWLVWHDSLASAITALAALLIVWKHRENIVRLREGRENKITFGKASA